MGPLHLRMFCKVQMAWGQGSDPSMQYSRVVLWSWEMLGQVLPPNSPALTELGFQILAHNLQGSLGHPVASQDVSAFGDSTARRAQGPFPPKTFQDSVISGPVLSGPVLVAPH